MTKASLSIQSDPERNSELKCMTLYMQSLPRYYLYLHFVGMYSVPEVFIAIMYYFVLSCSHFELGDSVG